MSEHYFKFSTNWNSNHERLCGDCHQTYNDGDHIEITTLKPYTSYVCPSGGGLDGHSAISTGEHRPELRTLRDHLCVCGAEFVEEDRETWRLSWEMQAPLGPPRWRPVSVVRSRHAAEAQRDGLLQLIEQGEPIRSVELVQLVEVTDA